MDDLRPAALQRLDDLHAGDETSLLVLEPVNLGDLLVELGDLGLDDRVALVLVPDGGAHLHPTEQNHERRGAERGRDPENEFLSLALALRLAPRQ